MLYSEQMHQICEKLGVKREECKDGLYSTLLQTISDACDGGGGGSGGGDEWIGDGNTHIWITLHEGRTSPMLGVGVNGTVTVDWGDGSAPDTLTGTSTSTVQWTPNHEYGKAGDYVITLTADGELGFSGYSSLNEHSCILRHSSTTDVRNQAYQNAVQKVELGEGITSIGDYAFSSCRNLAGIAIPFGVTSIGKSAFVNCTGLTSIAIPDGVTSLGIYAFSRCYNLISATIPGSVSNLNSNAFDYCHRLTNVALSDGTLTLNDYAFSFCYGIINIAIPKSVKTIRNYTFQDCFGVACYDFTKHTFVPTLGAKSAFNNNASDCIFKIPAALYDEWIAATNWSAVAATYTFVGV